MIRSYMGVSRLQNGIYVNPAFTCKLSLVNGTAFITNPSYPLREFIDRKITISDGSNSLVGWVKEAGPGETLGGELCSDPGYDNPGSWTIQTGWAISGSSAVATASPAYNMAYLTISTTVGALYKSVYTCSSYTSGNYNIMINYQLWNLQVSGGVKTYYLTKPATVQNYYGIQAGNIGLTAQFTDISTKQVLTPSTSGVSIVSTEGGSTYNWTSDGGINANAALFALLVTPY